MNPTPYLLVAALALSGCATQRYTPEQQLRLLEGLHNAGCGGSFDVEAGGETGQLGGGAHASLKVNAECPKGQVVPLKDVAKLGEPVG